MPYFKNKNVNVNVLFIHIPKTGGTSVEHYFSSKYNIPLNNKSLYLILNDEPLINANLHLKIKSSLQHITYTQMVEYNKWFHIDFDELVVLTIVRNPYERVISDLFFYKLITVETQKETVFDILVHNYLNATNYDNHNIPQHSFVTNDKGEIHPHIRILHTENLTNQMIEMGYSDFDIVHNSNANKVNYYDYLNAESIGILNKFYHLDFILFKYDKI
jgi:hypothetical protein